jgi:hypothetical protein
MTRKKTILEMVRRLPKDASYDRVIYHLTVLKKIEEGLEDAERGEGMEHEEFMRELMAEPWHESESSGRPGRKKTSGTSGGTSAGTRQRRQTRSSAE